jgi:hypothetical protein
MLPFLRGSSSRIATLATSCLCAVLVGGAAVSAPATTAPAEPAATSVTIHLGDVLERRFVGVGADFGPYPVAISESAWERNFARLDFMRPGVLRVMITASVYTNGYRADGTPIYVWDKPKMRQLRRILDWAQRRNVTVILGEWTLPRPHERGAGTWPARITTFVNHLYAGGYSVVRYYNLINEPYRNSYTEACAKAATAGQSPPPPVWRARWRCWRDAVTRLRGALDADPRARRIKLVGPDTTEWLKWHQNDIRRCPPARPGGDPAVAARGPVPDCWLRLTADRMGDRIGLYDVHRYSSIAHIESGALETELRGLRRHVTAAAGATPFILGEAGVTDPDGDENQQLRFDFRYGVWMADYLIQSIRAGHAGAIAWSLDDALHGADAVNPDGGYGSRHLKGWGFWNSLAGEYGYPRSDADPRPWFYPWSVLSRAFPAGARTLAVPATGVPGLRVTAARLPGAGAARMSIAVVNDADRPAAVTVTVPRATGRADLTEFRYFAGHRPVDANGLPVPRRRSGVNLARGLRVALPGRGMVVLSSADPAA